METPPTTHAETPAPAGAEADELAIGVECALPYLWPPQLAEGRDAAPAID